MNILLTGYGGLVGSYLASYLSANDSSSNLFLYSRKPTKKSKLLSRHHCLNGNAIFDPSSTTLKEIDLIVNCAGNARDSTQFKDSNLLFPVNLIRARLESSRSFSFIQLSSVGSYGASPTDKIINEDSVAAPSNPYEISKALAEYNLIEICKRNSIQLTLLQPSNIIDSSASSFALFPKLDLFFRRGFYPIFNQDPSQVWLNFISMQDVSKSILSLIRDDNPPVKLILNCCFTYDSLVEYYSSIRKIKLAPLSLPSWTQAASVWMQSALSDPISSAFLVRMRQLTSSVQFRTNYAQYSFDDSCFKSYLRF